MDKKLWWRGLTSAQKHDVADKANVAYHYLSNVMGGRANPSPQLVKNLVDYSNGILTKCDIRPDLYPREIFCKESVPEELQEKTP